MSALTWWFRKKTKTRKEKKHCQTKYVDGSFDVIFQVTVPVPRTNYTVERVTYPAYIAHQGFNAYYFDNANMHKECAVMAVISFCLTLVNIMCIIIAGSLFLKVCM